MPVLVFLLIFLGLVSPSRVSPALTAPAAAVRALGGPARSASLRLAPSAPGRAMDSSETRLARKRPLLAFAVNLINTQLSLAHRSGRG